MQQEDSKETVGDGSKSKKKSVKANGEGGSKKRQAVAVNGYGKCDVAAAC
jgi:hypothetical protein